MNSASFLRLPLYAAPIVCGFGARESVFSALRYGYIAMNELSGFKLDHPVHMHQLKFQIYHVLL